MWKRVGIDESIRREFFVSLFRERPDYENFSLQRFSGTYLNYA